ncbi:hypothetical protein BN11_4810002 [Nostocoides australiense Ben110]|uniref:Uncharacterized protein n=1 Tax=Nostocoides australiense Ben110 TaxID=1193182 RepID=W6JZZ5_9MICO|nr:hypothetical protein BN11_4810002 [Tetrasphaera australiensis Ben110]
MTWDAPTALDAAGHLLGYVVAARPWEGATWKSRPVPLSWSQSAEASHLNLSRVAATMTGPDTPCIHLSTGLWIRRPM